MATKKKKKDEEYWDNWCENFGKKMEDWGDEFGKKMEKEFGCEEKGFSVGGFVFGLFILAWGTIWLGNEMGFWVINFPFWPVIIILIGLAIILDTIRNALK
jgi:hypothetical protein